MIPLKNLGIFFAFAIGIILSFGAVQGMTEKKRTVNLWKAKIIEESSEEMNFDNEYEALESLITDITIQLDAETDGQSINTEFTKKQITEALDKLELLVQSLVQNPLEIDRLTKRLFQFSLILTTYINVMQRLQKNTSINVQPILKKIRRLKKELEKKPEEILIKKSIKLVEKFEEKIDYDINKIASLLLERTEKIKNWCKKGKGEEKACYKRYILGGIFLGTKKHRLHIFKKEAAQISRLLDQIKDTLKQSGIQNTLRMPNGFLNKKIIPLMIDAFKQFGRGWKDYFSQIEKNATSEQKEKIEDFQTKLAEAFEPMYTSLGELLNFFYENQHGMAKTQLDMLKAPLKRKVGRDKKRHFKKLIGGY